MAIYVAGATGFVGRATVQALLADDLEVVAVTRRREGGGRVPDRASVVSYDGLSPSETDCLVYLAEPSDMTAADPADAVARLGRVLESPWGTVVYASSGAVYGDGSPLPRLETDAPRAAGSYGRSKLDCERLALSHPCGTVLRLANVIGPGMSNKNVLSDILAQIGKPGPIMVRDRTAVRDFIDVEDVARAFALVVKAPVQGIFNVGSGEGVSVENLAKTAVSVAGQADRPVESTASADGKSELVLNITLMHDRFGWRPTRSLRQTLVSIIRNER